MTFFLVGSVKIKNNTKILKILGVGIIGASAYFFSIQFRDNWQQIDFQKTNINFNWIFISILFNCVCYLFITWAWQIIINTREVSRLKISFFRAIGIYNFIQLSKYIPGKVVGYLLQVNQLKKIGVNGLSAVYINVLILTLTIFYSFLFGINIFIDKININKEFLLILILFLYIFIFLIPKNNILEIFIQRTSNRLNKNIRIISIGKLNFLKINLCVVLSVTSLGLSGCSVIYGLGLNLEGRILETLTAFILSEIIGFLAIIVPGGIGVREVFLYSFLNNLGYGVDSITIPLLARVINIITDLILGVIAIFSLYAYREKLSPLK